MEPRIITICKENIGLRVLRRVTQDDYSGFEMLESGVHIETTQDNEAIQSIFIGYLEVPKLIQALKDIYDDWERPEILPDCRQEVKK